MVEIFQVNKDPFVTNNIFRTGKEVVHNRQIERFETKPILRMPRIVVKKAYGDVQDTVKENIKEIIKTYPLASKNDFILYIEYLNLTGQAKIAYGKDDVIIRIKKEDVLNITMPESTSRARRELFQDGEIDYDEDTKRIRKLMQEDIHAYFTSRKWDSN